MAKEQQVPLEDALSIAKDFHQQGNLTLADRTYREILDAVPTDFTSLHYLSIICYQRGVPEEGITFIKKALEIEDGNAESWNVYAVMLACIGNNEDAIPKWKKAVELNPNYPEAFSNMGNAYRELKQYDESYAACKQAVTIKPDYADAYINLGNALTSLKKHEEAIEAWQKTIELNPKQHQAFANIGNALRDLGRIKESEDYCRQSLDIFPDNPDALVNLGNALRDQGRFEEALDTYRKAIDLRPNFVNAHNNSTQVLIDLLRIEEAVVSSRYTIAFDPKNAVAHSVLSTALKMLGKLEEAEEAARKALRLLPDSAEALINLAEILFLSDRLSEAETLLNDAIEITPDSPQIFTKLASVLEHANRLDEALEMAEKAIELSPEMPEGYHRRAMVYFVANRIDLSLDSLNKALELKEDFPEALAMKSEILQADGRMEEAYEVTLAGLKLNNSLPSLYHSLGKLKKFTEDDPDFARMKELATMKSSYGKTQDTALNFALFKAYGDVNNYEKSFEHLKKANDIKRSIVVFDRHGQKAVYDSIRTTHTKEFIEKCSGKGHDTNDHIFIVGMPRSGTTLTEQVISSHPDVFGAGELYNLTEIEKDIGYITPENCKEHGIKYAEMTRAISEESKKAKKITDKMPGNYLRLGQIVAALPNAKIIHCRRNPVDTCLSCYKQLFARGHYWSYNLDDMAEHYALYDEMMNHWRETLPKGSFLEIDYEDTVNDLETQARKLINFVDLEWDDACLTPHKSKRAIYTASKGQVRQPVYKTSVEAWKRYEEQLTPFAEKLAPFMKK